MSKYPFIEMKIGESISVSTGPKDAHRLKAAAWIWRRRHPAWKFTFRKTETGGRLWRTA